MITIQEERMSNELLKHHLTGMPFDAVLHQFTGKDIGLPHCHPFSFRSHVLHGSYVEKVYTVHPDGDWRYEYVTRLTGDSFTVEATRIHEIIDLPEGACWTLILPGPKVRESRFGDFSGDIAKSKAWDEQDEKNTFNGN